jgi:DNA-binding helix-hairpin-helix protein with protein kinase domain
MPSYVQIGNRDEKTRFDLSSLKAAVKPGGQGDVYFPNSKICIKVLHSPDDFRIQLDNIARIIYNCNWLYDQIKAVCTVPLELVWDENAKKVIGYTMEQLIGWHGLHEIMTEADSADMGIDLRSSGLISAELSKALRIMHASKFIVGDLNPSNVLFKRERDRFLVKFIDADSLSIYHKDDLGIEYASKVLDIGVIYYADIIQADREGKPWPNFTPDHDWWAFACISWRILTKYDPFTTGMTPEEDREDRIIAGHTANSAAAVRLHPDCGPAAQALGPKLRLHLDRCLKRKVPRPFPTKILEDFANNLLECGKCGFTAHESAIFCPSCANLL